MTNIVDLRETRLIRHQLMLTKWARTFVTRYIEDGEEAAGRWALATIPEEFHDEMAPPIRAAFLEKGWTFNDDGPVA